MANNALISLKWGISVLKSFIHKIFSNSEAGRNAVSKRAAEEYAESKYRITSETLGIVYWEMDIPDDSLVGPDTAVEWSQDFRKSLGFIDEKDFPNVLASWSNRLHPDDKEYILAVLSAHLYDRTGKTSFDVEYRLMQKNGDYRNYYAYGTSLRNNDGTSVKMTGAQIDISEKKQLESMIKSHKDIIENKHEILNVLRNLGASLLTVNNDTLSKTLTRSMGLIGMLSQADRVQIWRNEKIGVNLHFSLAYEWLSELGSKLAPIKSCTTFPYEEVPGWEDKLKRGKHINSPVNNLLPHERVFFSRFNVKSLAVIPLITNDGYWGFLRVDDCEEERTFSEVEMIDIKLLGQLMAFAIILSENLDVINIEREKNRELAHWYKSILDSIPVPISVTNADMILTFVNTALENMMGKKRDVIYGKPCNTLDIEICNTNECGIACVKRYVNQTFFKSAGKTYKIDVSTIKDLRGETAGFVEVMQDVTVMD